MSDQPAGFNGDSLRSIKGMENITDDLLAARATFDPRNIPKPLALTNLDLTKLSVEELRGLIQAATMQLQQVDKET